MSQGTTGWNQPDTAHCSPLAFGNFDHSETSTCIYAVHFRMINARLASWHSYMRFWQQKPECERGCDNSYYLSSMRKQLAIICRYASDEGMQESAQYAGYRDEDVHSKVFQARARAKLFSPGQPMAVELAKNPTALIVNNTLFAHGGVLPEHGQPQPWNGIHPLAWGKAAILNPCRH